MLFNITKLNIEGAQLSGDRAHTLLSNGSLSSQVSVFVCVCVLVYTITVPPPTPLCLHPLHCASTHSTVPPPIPL